MLIMIVKKQKYGQLYLKMSFNLIKPTFIALQTYVVISLWQVFWHHITWREVVSHGEM